MRAFTLLDAPQRSPEWYAARLGRLTASDCKDALDVTRDGKPSAKRRDLLMRLVCERLTGQSQEVGFINADMRRGIDLEPEAFAAYEAERGVLVDRVGFVSHTELMTGGSPDGVVGDFEGIVEIKCPRPANHVRYLRTGEFREHEAQIRHLLWLTGAEWCDFASYCPQLPETMRMFVSRYARLRAETAEHETKVRAFLAEVDTEERALRGWSVMETA